MIQPTRRDLLRLGAALVVISPLRWFGSKPPVGGHAIGPLDDWLFRDATGARAVGTAYLRSHPEAERGSLGLAQLLHDHRTEDRNQLIALLRERIESDYRSDQLVLIDRWLLAETEAQACALTVLF